MTLLTISEIARGLPDGPGSRLTRAAFVAAASYATNTALAEALTPLKNSGSMVRGRSGGKSGVTEEPETKLQMPQAETSYVRPNGELYYTRPWGEHMDVPVLRRSRALSKFILLYGAPGTGKSALCEGAFGDELLTVLGSGDTEVADLVGGYVQTAAGGFFWEDGPLIKAAEGGFPLLIDEIGIIDPKVLTVVYGLMDGRREYTVTANPERGTVKAKEGFYVIAATNPNAPGVRLSEALLSRFSIHVEMSTDWNLARKLGVASNIVTASQNLSKKQIANETSWSPQFRELLAFRDLSAAFGIPFAIANLLAAAPENDRPVVSDVFSRVFGETCLPAKI